MLVVDRFTVAVESARRMIAVIRRVDDYDDPAVDRIKTRAMVPWIFLNGLWRPSRVRQALNTIERAVDDGRYR